jgi:hypothetical protein
MLDYIEALSKYLIALHIDEIGHLLLLSFKENPPLKAGS